MDTLIRNNVPLLDFIYYLLMKVFITKDLNILDIKIYEIDQKGLI